MRRGVCTRQALAFVSQPRMVLCRTNPMSVCCFLACGGHVCLYPHLSMHLLFCPLADLSVYHPGTNLYMPLFLGLLFFEMLVVTITVSKFCAITDFVIQFTKV